MDQTYVNLQWRDYKFEVMTDKVYWSQLLLICQSYLLHIQKFRKLEISHSQNIHTTIIVNYYKSGRFSSERAGG